MGFIADLAGDVGAECFAALGDAATYITSDGAAMPTRALLHREQQAEDHLRQRKCTASLPAAISPCRRGDRLECEGQRFTVVEEIKRDQIEVQLLLREDQPA